MKLIKSVVRPNKVDDVRDALEKMNIPGMTVTEVRGHGRQKGHTAIYRGKEYNVSLLPKMEIEIVVPDNMGGSWNGELIEGWLLVPECFDWIEARRTYGGHHSEEKADGCRESQADGERPPRKRDREAGRETDCHTNAAANENAEDASHQGQDGSFGEELQQNLLPPRS